MKKVIKRFTLDEQKQIVNLRKSGYTFKEIAQVLNRSSRGVSLIYKRFVESDGSYTQSNRNYTFSLTPAEYKVITLMCRGFNDKQIADILTLQVCSVKSHTNSIYQKYQVGGSTARVKCVLKHLGYEVA